MRWGLSVEERFWAYVDKRGPEECWLWKGSALSDKNPKFRITKNPPTIASARRLAYQFQKGPIHKKIVYPSCGNMRCMNGAHLLAKTSKNRLEAARERSRRRKNLVHEHKQVRGCKRCGEQNPIVLDHHHRDPKDKKFELSKSYTRSDKEILAELEKCDVLCANCHRIEHHEEENLKK